MESGVKDKLSKCLVYMNTIRWWRWYQEKLQGIAGNESANKSERESLVANIRDGIVSGFRMTRCRLSAIVGNITTGIVEKKEEVVDEQMDTFDFSKHDDFKVLCKEFIEYLMKLNEVHGNQIFNKELFLSTKEILGMNEVLVGFYGAGNTGKSTLLNAVLRDDFLPTACKSETAISVWIEFNNLFGGNNELAMLESGILAAADGHTEDFRPLHQMPREINVLTFDSEVIAEGVGEIRKTLRDLNKKAREGDKSTKKCCLKTRNKFGNSASSLKFILMDIPGFDEHGSLAVTQNCQISQVLTSAFIFVTSMSTYSLSTSNDRLLQLLKSHKELIQQDRLFIVITHLDDYQKDCEEDDKEYDEEKVVKDIAEYYNRTIFHFSDSDILKDKIILVCGIWALKGRLSQMYSNNIKYSDAIFLWKATFSKFRECPAEEFTDLLISDSNIKVLEERLFQIGENSEIIQKQKIVTDMESHLSGILKKLCEDMSKERETVEDRFKKIQVEHRFIKKVYDFYEKILNDSDDGNNIEVLKGMEIWRKFKTAYEGDMKGKKLYTTLLQTLDQKFVHFEEKCRDKMRTRYTPRMFEEDMSTLLENIFKFFHVEMSSWNNYKKLSNAYTDECSTVYAIAQNLKDCGQVSSADTESGATAYPEAPPLIPELTTSALNASIQIPYGELSIFQTFWRYLKLKFGGIKSPTSYECMINCTVPQNFEESATLQQPESSRRNSNSAYREWTGTLDEQTKYVKQQFVEYVTKFYEDGDQNIVQICCKQYFQASIKVLQMYDTSMSMKLEECSARLEESLNSMEEELHKLEDILKLHTYLKEMKDDFHTACKKYLT